MRAWSRGEAPRERRQGANQLLTLYAKDHGASGAVTACLAQVQAEMGQHALAEVTLWKALRLAPDHEPAVAWYGLLHREREGHAGWVAALRRVAAIAGGWRALAWLARERIDAKDLRGALGLYLAALSRVGTAVPEELVAMMAADLGPAGYQRVHAGVGSGKRQSAPEPRQE